MVPPPSPSSSSNEPHELFISVLKYQRVSSSSWIVSIQCWRSSPFEHDLVFAVINSCRPKSTFFSIFSLFQKSSICNNKKGNKVLKIPFFYLKKNTHTHLTHTLTQNRRNSAMIQMICEDLYIYSANQHQQSLAHKVSTNSCSVSLLFLQGNPSTTQQISPIFVRESKKHTAYSWRTSRNFYLW